jgi:hypothetical protein
MRVVVREDRRGDSRNPGAPAGESEQHATLTQEGEVGAQTWGFFSRRPRVTFPVGDGLLVALDGAALGYLITPVPATHALPDARRMVAHAKVRVKHRRQALHGPQFVGEASRAGAVEEQPQLPALGIANLLPAIHRAHGRPHPPSDLAGICLLCQEHYGATALFF